jgi:hypothetical protein
MRQALRTLCVLAGLVGASSAAAAGYNRVYLVQALKQCTGLASCPREFESAYTFDAIVLRTPASRYAPPSKPTLILEIRGVRDAADNPVNGTLSLRLLSGRVSVPGVGTFPDDSPLTQQPLVPIPLKNGNAKVPYKPPLLIPNGLIVNGGGVEVLDPDGKLLAVTGSQSKP